MLFQLLKKFYKSEMSSTQRILRTELDYLT